MSFTSTSWQSRATTKRFAFGQKRAVARRQFSDKRGKAAPELSGVQARAGQRLGGDKIKQGRVDAQAVFFNKARHVPFLIPQSGHRIGPRLVGQK